MKYPVEFDGTFKENQHKGTYIVVEGIDGSGKSTQVESLQDYFRQKGKDVVITSEPTSDLVTGKLMRDILNAKIKIPSIAFQDIYSADRVINHEQIILPALKQGKVVLSHRSFWSAIAYGVFDKGETHYNQKEVDPILVAHGIFSHYYQFTVADYTFYLDVPVDVAIERFEAMGKKGDIYENKEKLAKIVKGYHWLMQQFPDRITAIDANLPAELITQAIIKKINL